MQFDVDSIKTRLINTLRSKASWAKILFYSTNQRLIDTMAEGLAELARYDEYLTRETKWTLSLNRSSLTTQSKVVGYTAHRKIGSSGILRIGIDTAIGSETWISTKTFKTGDTVYYNDILYKSIQDSNLNKQPDTEVLWWSLLDIKPSNTVLIPKYSVFSDSASLKMTNINTENLTTTDNFIDIEVIQGIPKSTTAIAQGDIYEEIDVNNVSIENSEYEIYVNGVLWTEISDLRLTADGTAKNYEISNKIDFSGITLKFGNDTFGKKLEIGDVVLFKYVETLGVSGNISTVGVIDTVESTIYDSVSSIVDLKCYNLQQFDGGTDEETIENIRTMGSNVFQTGDRAVSKLDWKTILLQNNFIQNAVVWGEYEYNIDNGNIPGTYVSVQENVVHISAYTPSGTQLSSSQKDSIRSYLNDYKAPTDIPQFTDVEFINLTFNSTVYISDRSYVLSTVKNTVTTQLEAEYDVNNLDFKQDINESDYKAFIDGLDGVDYHDTSVKFYIFSTFNTAYEATITIPLFSIKKSSLEIYVKDTTDANATYVKIATDDGAGGFTAESGYDLTGSSINYDTGEGSLIVVSGLGATYSYYSIKAYWQTNSNNLTLLKRNQIFKYGEANITTQYTTL